MLRKIVSYGGTLLLVGAVIFATPAVGWAQRGGGHGGGGGHFGGGGGHFGGGHFGGGHFGGGHFGGGHFGGGHFGGTRIGGFHNGLHHNGFGYYRRSFYGGYYPYYGSSYPYYDTYPYAGSSPAYDSGYYGSYADVTPSYGDDYAYYANAGSTPDSTPARLTVKVPADAEVWFDGTKTKTTGSVREYQSPPLTPGSQYSYEIQARWNENGHEVTQTQHVSFAPGRHVDVNFPVPTTTTGSASPAKKD
jgi:uncharacterized protein (TIGR03000 family)